MAHERSPIIVAIADGGVVDVGSHDQLMAAKGFCHDLCMSRSRRGAAPAGLASGEGFGLQPLKLRLVDRRVQQLLGPGWA
jgi:hypothetical protein